MSFGGRGNAVRELRRRLQQWAGVTPDENGSDVFDDPLRQLVLQFQRSSGLTADGVAGSRTQALLDARLAAAGTPLLSSTIK
jgi:murein L,D-transpeptidase YcbB/YkuD